MWRHEKNVFKINHVKYFRYQHSNGGERTANEGTYNCKNKGF